MSPAATPIRPDDRSAAGAPIVSMRGIAKHFGGVLALDGVDFDLRPGEVHALLGENGAGKSTLIKILAGVYSRDGGELRIGGNELPQHFTPAMVREAGLGFVHQDLGLINELSVAENIALGCGYRSHGPLIDFAATARQATELLEAVSVSLPPKAMVGDLTQDQRVMVAVARAFSLDARAIVLDEVSSSLPAPDVRRLCEALVRSKQQSGVGYVYVTHRLDELFGLADRVTVLRDGQLVATADLAGVSHAELVDWIVGEAKEAPAPRARRAAPTTEGGLVVRDLEGPELSAPVTFTAGRGEIVGVCGLVGSGSRALASLLGGGTRMSGGSVVLDGEPLPVGDPVAMRRNACAYVPGDRQREGGIGALSIRENLFLGPRTGAGESAALHPRRERSEAVVLQEKFRVKPAGDPDRALETLSGGNQQKVICGRVLRSPTRLLVVDDPTAGVDVGARLDLHALIRACAVEGTIVILASTDFDEVALEADRALVMAHGAVVAELTGDELTAEALARASYVNPRPEERR